MKSLSHVRLLVTPWTVAHQAPPSMGFSRQEYWSGVPLPSPPNYSNAVLINTSIVALETHEKKWGEWGDMCDVVTLLQGFPSGSVVKKNPTCQCRRQKRPAFDPWVRKIPWRRERLPTPVFLPGDSYGQRSLSQRDGHD